MIERLVHFDGVFFEALLWDHVFFRPTGEPELEPWRPKQKRGRGYHKTPPRHDVFHGRVDRHNIRAKPFEFPFKVSDLIYLTSKERGYCFFQPPREIKEELSDLNQENILVEDDACPENSIKVCFTSSDGSCDINVDRFQKSVEKRGEVMYYETDSLMYAAVFSDKNIYECQVKRLMKRTSELAKLYDEKQQLLMKQGCVPSVNLQLLENAAKSVSGSRDLVSIRSIVNEVDIRNYVMCSERFTIKLW